MKLEFKSLSLRQKRTTPTVWFFFALWDLKRKFNQRFITSPPKNRLDVQSNRFFY